VIDETRVIATGAVAPWLTNLQSKRTIFADDLYYWEGWAAFIAACSGEPDEAMLRHLTFVLIKPEAAVGRRFDAILDFLLGKGFSVAGAWPVHLSRHAVRALWGYQINSVPTAHHRSLEMSVTSGELFIVGLVHPLAQNEAVSAAELLRLSKGISSRPGGATLRDQLNGPARMLSFVHAPDEAADVIRELAVICDGADRPWPLPPDPDAAPLNEVVTTLARAASEPGNADGEAERSARKMMTSRYPGTATHDLNADATLQRMRGYLRDGLGAELPSATLAAIESGYTTPQQALEVVMSLERAHALPLWDRIVTLAYLTDSLRNGHSMLITPPP
jgi:hypothetical protein